MSSLPMHVAGGIFGGARSVFSDAATPLTEPELPPPNTSRRRKLWEISHKFHCPLIGVCFDCDELHRLMNKVMHLPRAASDFLLHTTAVGCCEERSRLADVLHKALEKRYRLSVRQYAAIKSGADLRTVWRAACKDGNNIPAVLWACWTHPACDETLAQEIYGDIHMIQHQLGAHKRADLTRLKEAQEENAELRRQLVCTRSEAERLRQEKATLASDSLQRLGEVRAELVASQTWAAGLTRELAWMREHVPDLEARQSLSQRLADTQAQLRAAQGQSDELTREVLRLREFAKHAEETIESLVREDEALDALPRDHLSGKCVLCVGGRSGAVTSYRAVVEQSGGQFMHHDGGLEESLHRIDGALAAADIVICQAGCISHNAYWRVKEQCKRTGKPCMFVKGSGVSSFGRVVNSLARKEP